jgi:hypothetical protein
MSVTSQKIGTKNKKNCTENMRNIGTSNSEKGSFNSQEF